MFSPSLFSISGKNIQEKTSQVKIRPLCLLGRAPACSREIASSSVSALYSTRRHQSLDIHQVQGGTLASVISTQNNPQGRQVSFPLSPCRKRLRRRTQGDHSHTAAKWQGHGLNSDLDSKLVLLFLHLCFAKWVQDTSWGSMNWSHTI